MAICEKILLGEFVDLFTLLYWGPKRAGLCERGFMAQWKTTLKDLQQLDGIAGIKTE